MQVSLADCWDTWGLCCRDKEPGEPGAWSALLGVTRSVWLLCEGCLGEGKHLCGETSEDVCDRITGKRVVGYMDKSYGSKGKKKKKKGVGWAS